MVRFGKKWNDVTLSCSGLLFKSLCTRKMHLVVIYGLRDAQPRKITYPIRVVKYCK